MGGFQQLGSIVGGVLINAFKPFVQALNSVMGAVINFAQVVSDALGAIFGWEYQTGGGVAQDLEYGASAAEDLEDATGGAAKNAKKMNKYIAGWHEVNNMTSDDKDKGSGGGGGAGGMGDLANADGGKWLQKESLWEKYKSNIDSLYQLGDYIGNTLTKTMQSIDWNKVYESAINFGTGLATFLNGLISPELFGATGQTIAGALNTAIYAALSFESTFDWTDFGNSIASGVNNFFETFDFGALANTIDAWVQGICTTIKTTIEKIDWKTVWNGIKEFISELDLGTVGIIIGTVFLKSIGRLVIGGGILKQLARTFGIKLAEQLGTAPVITTVSAGIKALFGSAAAKSSLTFMFPKAAAVLSSVTAWVTGTLIPTVSGLGTTIATAIFSPWGIAIAVGLAGIFAIITNWDEIKTFFGETLPTWWNETAIPFFQSIPDKLGEIWENVKSFASEKWGQFLDYMESVPDKINDVVTSIGEWFGQLPEKIGYGLGFAYGKVTQWMKDSYDYLKAKVPELVSRVGEWFDNMKDKIYESIHKFVTETLPKWKDNVVSFFTEKIPEIISNVAEKFADLKNKVGESINKFITETLPKWKDNVINFFRDKVPEIINNVVNFFGDLKTKMLDVGENIITGLWEGMNNMTKWIGDKISNFVDGVIKGFKDGFDEHSPSKISYEIGDYWSIGLGNGMVEGFDDIYRQIDRFTTNVADMEVPVPKLNTDIPKLDIKPKAYDLGKIKSTMNMEMDAKMAQSDFEMRQLREEMHGIKGILAEINDKGIVFDDTMMERKFKSASNKYFNRTGEQLGLA